MTTKNFKLMTTKKLEALYQTATDEDKAQIMEVLEARKQVAASPTAEEAPLTAEEEAAIKAAEEGDGSNPMYNGSKSTIEKKPKLTDDELDALLRECRKNVGHICQVVPFNTIEWQDGYIAGCVAEKRTRKVLYAIKLDDGRRIVKVHDSNLLRILDEMACATVRKRSGNKEPKERKTEEQIQAEAESARANIGKIIRIERGDELNDTVTYEGRIIAVMIDRRVGKVLYRIAVPAPTAENSAAVKTMYKIVSSTGYSLVDEFDEIGAEMNQKASVRRDKMANAKAISPVQRVKLIQESIEKIEENIAKLKAKLEEKNKALSEAEAEAEKYLESVMPDAASEEKFAEADSTEELA